MVSDLMEGCGGYHVNLVMFGVQIRLGYPGYTVGLQ